MKVYSLACFLAPTLAKARYSVTSKLTNIDHTINLDYETTNNILTGKILKSNKKLTFENSQDVLTHNIENPCYIYFSEDSEVHVDFAYFYDGYPLQVTPQHIFFWPSLGQKEFTVNLQTVSSKNADSEESEGSAGAFLNKSNTAVYCGDLADILGEHPIESERALSIRLGSFPQEKHQLQHEGYFRLVQPVQPDCTVQLHFPPHQAPASFKFVNSNLDQVIEIQKLHNNRSIIMSNFDKLSQMAEENGVDEIGDIYFELEYESVDQISYSYNVIAEVMCPSDNARGEIDQSEKEEADSNSQKNTLDFLIQKLKNRQ